MAGQKYNKAYEAYQQAVSRDVRNLTIRGSIGMLYSKSTSTVTLWVPIRG